MNILLGSRKGGGIGISGLKHFISHYQMDLPARLILCTFLSGRVLRYFVGRDCVDVFSSSLFSPWLCWTTWHRYPVTGVDDGFKVITDHADSVPASLRVDGVETKVIAPFGGRYTKVYT